MPQLRPGPRAPAAPRLREQSLRRVHAVRVVTAGGIRGRPESMELPVETRRHERVGGAGRGRAALEHVRAVAGPPSSRRSPTAMSGTRAATPALPARGRARRWRRATRSSAACAARSGRRPSVGARSVQQDVAEELERVRERGLAAPFPSPRSRRASSRSGCGRAPRCRSFPTRWPTRSPCVAEGARRGRFIRGEALLRSRPTRRPSSTKPRPPDAPGDPRAGGRIGRRRPADREARRRTDRRTIGRTATNAEASTLELRPRVGPCRDPGPGDERRSGRGRAANATPVARKAALELGLSLQQVSGTGPAAGSPPSTSDRLPRRSTRSPRPGFRRRQWAVAERSPWSSRRRRRQTIARRMAHSAATVPVFTVSADVDVSQIVARAQDRARGRRRGAALAQRLRRQGAQPSHSREFPRFNAS